MKSVGVPGLAQLPLHIGTYLEAMMKSPRIANYRAALEVVGRVNP